MARRRRGAGYALQRKDSAAYGNDPINWTVGAPTPGRPNDDRDGDGLPDALEIANGTNPDVADAADDPDHDGLSNMQEYLAGTDPQKPESVLAFERITFLQPSLAMEFTARSNHTYRLLVGNTIESSWSPLLGFPARSTDRTESIAIGTTNVSRFYRLVTP